jgi:hypothetical protein
LSLSFSVFSFFLFFKFSIQLSFFLELVVHWQRMQLTIHWHLWIFLDIMFSASFSVWLHYKQMSWSLPFSWGVWSLDEINICSGMTHFSSGTIPVAWKPEIQFWTIAALVHILKSNFPNWSLEIFLFSFAKVHEWQVSLKFWRICDREGSCRRWVVWLDEQSIRTSCSAAVARLV